MVLYKSVLHHHDNMLPKWILELLGVYVSHLNGCSYCVDHHSVGLRRLLNDKTRYESILLAIEDDTVVDLFDNQIKMALLYAKKLTTDHKSMDQSDIEQLKNSGLKDGEILEINQVVSYFNYVNRTVLGLGVNTEGDILGLSPNDNNDPDNWSHE
jgi:uncharacterized peroxidase-related enzyme